MQTLASELYSNGYERTERESPFDEDAQLWTNSYELICASTGTVIRKDNSKETENNIKNTNTDYKNPYSFERDEYYLSGETRMMGGYASSYEWGYDEKTSKFTYE